MNCGEIYLVEFPFSDGGGSKLRPVLVVSQSPFNLRGDVVVLPITSRPDVDPFVVAVPSNAPEFPGTKLKQSSGIKWTKPFTISKHLIRRRLGEYAQPKLDNILALVASLFRAEAS